MEIIILGLSILLIIACCLDKAEKEIEKSIKF